MIHKNTIHGNQQIALVAGDNHVCNLYFVSLKSHIYMLLTDEIDSEVLQAMPMLEN